MENKKVNANKNTEILNNDCIVCYRLIEEKHRNDFVYKVGFFVMCIISVLLAILYFGTGALAKKTDVNVTVNTNGGSVDKTIIGDSSTISGTINNSENTLGIICLCIIALAIIIGGVIIANHFIRESKNKCSN